MQLSQLRPGAHRLVVGAIVSSAVMSAGRLAHAVEGGSEDHVTTHAVVIAAGAPSRPSVRCSGTLISSNVVLTARHCLSPLAAGTPSCEQSFGSPPGSPGDLWVSAAPWSLPAVSWKHVAAWVFPEIAEVCGNDVAMLVLAEPIGETEATPARVAISQEAFLRAVSPRVLGVAGFGATSPRATDSGVRRSRFDIPIRCVPGSSLPCDGALDSIDARELTSGAGPCLGDSGAGALDAGDRGVVFGVLSRGNLAGDTCSEGIFERTDVWRWLIAKTVLAAVPPGATAPEWARGAFPERPAAGELCSSAEACADDADCVSFDGRRSFVCATRCTSGCGEGFRCESNVCAPDPASPSSAADGGCAVVSPTRSGASMFVEVASACAFFALVSSRARRRRRRG